MMGVNIYVNSIDEFLKKIKKTFYGLLLKIKNDVEVR
jgi:hypothetical protein